jgi:1,4-dihydroxy-2-naphthoate octaprenyltransferase
LSKLSLAFGSVRPAFLLLTPTCLLTGIGTAVYSGAELDYLVIALIIIAAICAHASVNLLNEYSDFKSGLDLKTRKTPFSGGSGTLPAYPELSSIVLALGILFISITVAIGLFLAWQINYWLIALGLAGVIIILIYTKWINRWPWICLVTPGLAFGPIMVMGTHLALTGNINTLSAVASLIPFFVVNNLLLLNQVPDIEADKSVGRNHFAIKYGFEKTVHMHRILGSAAIITILYGYITGLLPFLSLVAALPIAINLKQVTDENLLQRMAFNVMTAITAPALLAGPMLLY